MSTVGVDKQSADITVGLLKENELPDADRIFRLAFGTFIGLPEPEEFHKGGDYIRTRWITDPNAFFAARDQERLIGSNFGTNWGSV
ncbi:MAG TPA: hypothetical protein VFV61_07785, partial [Pyrinomonadaceae bacterium]|nr:hypothetical protein [Pyrinomonadaceae bacterium]